jgi:ABC-type thiamin/hydroxymethylpyrimidine transport system permease subunit
VGYRLILLIIVIALAARHACSTGPSLLSKWLVVGLTAVLVFIYVRWPAESLVTVPLLAAIGAYGILHQIVMSWQREVAEAERAPQEADHSVQSYTPNH